MVKKSGDVNIKKGFPTAVKKPKPKPKPKGGPSY